MNLADTIVTLGMARMLRRLRNAGAPLSRHALQHGTSGCTGADIDAAVDAGLVEMVPAAPGTPGKPGRRPFARWQVTALGLDVLGAFRFPASGRKPAGVTDEPAPQTMGQLLRGWRGIGTPGAKP